MNAVLHGVQLSATNNSKFEALSLSTKIKALKLQACPYFHLGNVEGHFTNVILFIM